MALAPASRTNEALRRVSAAEAALQVDNQLFQHGVMVSRFGRFGGDLLGQCPSQFLDGRIPRDDRLAKRSLLPIESRRNSDVSSSN